MYVIRIDDCEQLLDRKGVHREAAKYDGHQDVWDPSPCSVSWLEHGSDPLADSRQRDLVRIAQNRTDHESYVSHAQRVPHALL